VLEERIGEDRAAVGCCFGDDSHQIRFDAQSRSTDGRLTDTKAMVEIVLIQCSIGNNVEFQELF